MADTWFTLAPWPVQAAVLVVLFGALVGAYAAVGMAGLGLAELLFGRKGGDQ